MTKQVVLQNKKENIQQNEWIITRFEDLSNELLYEIFDYFDNCYTYETFFNLNTRFNNLIIYSSLPLKLNFSLLSKGTFRNRCNTILIPNIHRIHSIRLSNHLLIDQFFTSVSLNSSFTRLEMFILDNAKSDDLIPILFNLALLPRLYSLSITTIEQIESPNFVYCLIIRLPVLKYCKLSFGLWNRHVNLSLNSSEYSSIEHLIIDAKCSLIELNELLTHTPQLNRLSCKISTFNSSLSAISIIPKNLNNIYLQLEDTSFDEFVWFISSFSQQFQVLRISAERDMEFLNANRWERLIAMHMPFLRKFYFQYKANIGVNFETYHRYHNLMKDFNSSFWSNRKWFFTHQHYDSWIRFYSIQPYRWKQYEIHEDTCQNHETGLNLARTVDLHNYRAITQCSIPFSCTTRLIISEGNIKENPSFISDLPRLFSPIQITELVISNKEFQLENLFLFLHHFPNIQFLTIPTSTLYLSSHQSETNRLIFDKNNIIKVIIVNQCTLEDIRILIRICPYLQSLQIEVEKENLELVVRFLLLKNTTQNPRDRLLTRSKSKNITFWQHEYSNCIRCTKTQTLNSSKISSPCNHQLSSLCCRDVNYRMIEKLRTMINQETLLNDFLIEYLDQNMYLWW